LELIKLPVVGKTNSNSQRRGLTRKTIWVWFFIALFSGLVSGQTIESLQWVDVSGQPVARITFNASVRFLRQAPPMATDLSQLSFQIVAAEDAVLKQTIEEGKRLVGADSKLDVGIVLTYVPSPSDRTQQLNLHFSKKVHVSARQGPGARMIDLDFVDGPGADFSQPALPKLPTMAQTEDQRQYAVVLQTFAVADAVAMPRVPAEFQDYAVFTRTFEQGSDKVFALTLGYFRTKQDAEVVLERALVRFPTAKVLKLEVEASAVTAATPVPTLPPPIESESVAAVESPATAAEVNSKAESLLLAGRQALTEQRWQEAADILNQVLLLPPNPSSQEAQELIGSVWEGLRQPEKARIEYQLYLKLYPNAEGAARVTQRLTAMGGAKVDTGNKSASAPVKPSFSYTGSISQYYYGGQSKTDSLVNISAGIDQNTLSRTNQSALVTSVDILGRFTSENSDTKLVLRDSFSQNFISSTNTQSGLSSVYVDYRIKDPKVDVRLGRQSAIGGSSFGLFDGISVAMPIASKYKLGAMIGVPANTLVSAPSQRLAGVTLEADNLFEHWGGNISLADQSTEGISDRRAMGVEVRYFGENLSVYSQVDYELNFKTLNALTLQGSLQGPYDTTITMLVDDRKAPSLQLSDALISSGVTSLKTLLQLKSLSEVQDMALATAAQAKQVMFSVSRALSPKWQGSVDLRYSEIGALPAVGDFQATPATGAQIGVSLQLTGSNLYSKRDINGFNISVLNSDTMTGTQIAYNNLTGFLGNKATFEPSLRLYTQTDNTSTKVVRISPGVRVSYKVTERASMLGEVIYEESKTDGPTNHENSSSVFFYVGYRYDFF